jgi:hypothetical protein
MKDCNVSNFNKSGFQIKVVTSDQVYISLNCEAIYNANLDNRELVTAVATINYKAQKVLVIIIFKGVYYCGGVTPRAAVIGQLERGIVR